MDRWFTPDHYIWSPLNYLGLWWLVIAVHAMPGANYNSPAMLSAHVHEVSSVDDSASPMLDSDGPYYWPDNSEFFADYSETCVVCRCWRNCVWYFRTGILWAWPCYEFRVRFVFTVWQVFDLAYMDCIHKLHTWIAYMDCRCPMGDLTPASTYSIHLIADVLWETWSQHLFVTTFVLSNTVIAFTRSVKVWLLLPWF